jgi:hypothetical protein
MMNSKTLNIIQNFKKDKPIQYENKIKGFGVDDKKPRTFYDCLVKK